MNDISHNQGDGAKGDRRNNRDFHVYARINIDGWVTDIDSVVPLHEKVRAHLEQRTDLWQFQVYDAPYGMEHHYAVQNSPAIAGHKVFCVFYSLFAEGEMGVGGGGALIFDQAKGDLLYEGHDGGE